MLNSNKKLLEAWMEADDVFAQHQRKERLRSKNGQPTDLERYLETGIALDW